MAVGNERPHAKLIGQRQAISVPNCRFRSPRRASRGRHVTEKLKRPSLMTALAKLARPSQSSLSNLPCSADLPSPKVRFAERHHNQTTKIAHTQFLKPLKRAA